MATLGIDASNISSGGGLVHLVQLLAHASPDTYGFSRVVLWAPQATLASIAERPWLQKRHVAVFEAGYVRRAWWQARTLRRLLDTEQCDLLLVPGGSFATSFRPVVTMNQNLLPFAGREIRRYGWSLLTLRFLALRRTQSQSLAKAAGAIFLTEHAQNVVVRQMADDIGEQVVIPHGVDPRFLCTPRAPRSLDTCSVDAPLRIVYVSAVDWYKHQWHVAQAVAILREAGLPLQLTMIGPAYAPARRKLQKTLSRLDREGKFLQYIGAIDHAALHAHYRDADIAVFASTCETFGQILTEAMASGLPIACSNRACMPEILGTAGVYFDPEHPPSIAAAIKQLAVSTELRAQLAQSAHRRVQSYSWQRCAGETFAFLQQVLKTQGSAKNLQIAA